MITLPEAQQLHVRRFGDPDGQPVLLLHGLLEDGSVYYSRTGQGLAHFLAQAGFDVFVPDLRGKGRSWPAIEQVDQYRLLDLLSVDLPAILETIERHNPQLQIWMGHAFGGVFLSALLARYPEFLKTVMARVYFGSCRVFEVVQPGPERWLDQMWRHMLQWWIQLKRFLPDPLTRYDPVYEHEAVMQASLELFGSQQWIDPDDGFDYSQALFALQGLPPTLYFASGQADGYGCKRDVARFVRENGHHDARMVVLGKSGGNLHNYSHISMLTHPDAWRDHFPFMLRWLHQISEPMSHLSSHPSDATRRIGDSVEVSDRPPESSGSVRDIPVGDTQMNQAGVHHETSDP